MSLFYDEDSLISPKERAGRHGSMKRETEGGRSWNPWNLPASIKGELKPGISLLHII